MGTCGVASGVLIHCTSHRPPGQHVSSLRPRSRSPWSQRVFRGSRTPFRRLAQERRRACRDGAQPVRARASSNRRLWCGSFKCGCLNWSLVETLEACCAASRVLAPSPAPSGQAAPSRRQGYCVTGLRAKRR
eukprot:358550-Chlamydomonas_euryale.AAC.1